MRAARLVVFIWRTPLTGWCLALKGLRVGWKLNLRLTPLVLRAGKLQVRFFWRCDGGSAGVAD
jgi:hypothetical protein